MMQYIKRFGLLLVIVILVFFLGVFIYYSVQDIRATKAKDYLIKEYDYDKFEIFTLKATEYVNKNEVNCSSVWFKKCTDNENLYKEIYFVDKNKEKIFVTEYKDGTFKVEKND